jgi:hypothetical protein
LFATLFLMVAYPSLAAARPRQGHDILGAVWNESENGWSGVYTRRGASNVFDAVWTLGASRVTAILTMTQTGPNTVSIYRQDTSDTMEVDYTGSIAHDGSVTGSGKVRGTGFAFNWTATVQGRAVGPGPSPAPAPGPGPAQQTGHDILGAVWNESENGWSGVYTRRGASNVFDAVWTMGGARVTAILTMTQTGPNTVSIYRQDTSDSDEVDYTATISPDGSVTGAGKVRRTGLTFGWNAKIQYRADHPGAGWGRPDRPANVDRPPPRNEPPAADRLGSVWYESENGWSGVWTRRGTGDLFDAVWTMGGSRVTGTLTITLTGANTFCIHRQDSTDNVMVDYTGTIARDGSVSGSGRVKRTGVVFDWTAKIR